MNNDHQPRYEHELTLAPLPTEVRRARRFTRFVLQERRIAPERIVTAELLVSELVTNAVKMTRVTKLPAPYRTVHDYFRLISLRLSLVASSVVIEVRDGSDNPPALQEQCLDSEDGRGLAVVESLSSQWNYFRLSSGGKVVWCELHVARPAAGDDMVTVPNPLPRRSSSGRATFPSVVVTHDRKLLQRVRDGLAALDTDTEPGR